MRELESERSSRRGSPVEWPAAFWSSPPTRLQLYLLYDITSGNACASTPRPVCRVFLPIRFVASEREFVERTPPFDALPIRPPQTTAMLPFPSIPRALLGLSTIPAPCLLLSCAILRGQHPAQRPAGFQPPATCVTASVNHYFWREVIMSNHSECISSWAPCSAE